MSANRSPGPSRTGWVGDADWAHYLWFNDNQKGEGEQPVAGFLQAVGDGAAFEAPFADERLAPALDLAARRGVDHVAVVVRDFLVQGHGRGDCDACARCSVGRPCRATAPPAPFPDPSRTRAAVPVQDQPHDRLFGERRRIPGVPVAFRLAPDAANPVLADRPSPYGFPSRARNLARLITALAFHEDKECGRRRGVFS